jgi:signal transduction histidine kinase
LRWPEIRQSLLENVRDLLPAAELMPSDGYGEDKQRRMLAAIPARLAPGSLPINVMQFDSPIRMTLLVAWICVIIGSGAVALLLWGAISLSERRGAFVSAVTHELRTPLTTLSMYSEMLEQGMVQDESRKQQYLTTLRAEANRLGHLVENVLAYSRIERGRADGRIQTIPIPELIDAVKERLGERARQAGMQLAIELPADASAMAVKADASAVEQILFNLVDNAGKYASSAKDRRIHLSAQANGSAAMIRLADHGPGISRAESRKLFRPFSKSAREAANSAPGVGLGLALSRRLARQMKGDLKLEDTNGGASFVLTLPLADR